LNFELDLDFGFYHLDLLIMITYDSDLKIFFSSLINDDRYFSGFTTRELNDGRKVENIVSFFRSNNIGYKKIVVPEQIHSVNIELIENSGEDFEKKEDCDGLVTKETGVILTVRTGDCLPIIFTDKQSSIIGISHQGWRGSVKRMAQKIVKKMLEIGAKMQDITVALGPGIGECCYDIDEDRFYEFKEEFDGYSDKIFHFYAGKRHLNLSLLNYLLLIETGIKKENIDYFPFCTSCNKEMFFSFRRDKKENYGEMFSFILKVRV